MDELYQNKVESTTTLVSTSNHVLYAKWNINSYTLTVDLNNGTCTGCAVTGSQNYGAVVALGTPTRTNYSFTGWTITSGTATLSGSNLTIGTSDVTVQANWQLASYTISLNANGGTVSTSSLTINVGSTYGTIPTPTLSGSVFKGWYTLSSGGTKVSSTDVPTSDTTLYAQWYTSVSFASDSWETIQAYVKAGIASTAYSVGDTKTINLGTTFGNHTVRIANMSSSWSYCGSAGYSQTACGFVVEFADIISEHYMYEEMTNVGGWASSSMRNYVNNTIYNSLPSDLKSVIVSTSVVSSHECTNFDYSSLTCTSGETNYTTSDQLYLLSAHEVWTDTDNDATDGLDFYDTTYNYTRQLDYYNDPNGDGNNSDRLTIGSINYETFTRYGTFAAASKSYNSTASCWYLRAASSDNDAAFFGVLEDGSWYDYGGSNEIGVSPAFRIA